MFFCVLLSNKKPRKKTHIFDPKALILSYIINVLETF